MIRTVVGVVQKSCVTQNGSLGGGRDVVITVLVLLPQHIPLVLTPPTGPTASDRR